MGGNPNFELVIVSNNASLEYSRPPTELPFTAAGAAVISTGDGSVFKIGNALETKESIIFDRELLQ